MNAIAAHTVTPKPINAVTGSAGAPKRSSSTPMLPGIAIVPIAEPTR